MSQIRILLVLVAMLSFNICALQAQVDRSVSSVKIAVPLIPPDRTIVRLNGTDALTRKLVPAVLPKLEYTKDHWNIPCNKCSHEFLAMETPRVGATWKAYLTDISLDVPVDANSLESEFRSAPSNQGEIDTEYRFENAKLKFTFHVETKPTTALDSMVPSQVKEWTTISDSFPITVTGMSGSLDVTLKKNGESVAVDRVDQFTIQAGHVSVTDSARLLEIANKVASLSDLFGVSGATSVNNAATKLANFLVKERFREDLRKAVSNSLEKTMSMDFGTQRIAVGRGGTLSVTGPLKALRTTSGNAVTEWSVGVEGDPSGAAPQLAYVPVVRPAEDVNQLAAHGDVQIFVPYSLVDKTMYELVKMGTLGKITVPRSSANGITVGFDLVAEPTETPRVDPATDDPNGLVVTFAARLADTTIGSIDVGLTTGATSSDSIGGPRTGPTVPDRVPVRLTNGSARVALTYRLLATDRGGLVLYYISTNLDELTGSLSAASVTTPVNQLRVPLQNAIHNHLRSTMPRIALIQRAVPLIPGVRVSIEAPRQGVRYLGLPLTLIAE